MRKKIAIFGSTGSIGRSLVDIIKKDRKNFEVILLTANKNDKVLIKQARSLNVKNIIITDKKKYQNLIKQKNIKIKIFNDFNNLNKIFTKKLDYIMSSITGINGLEPTYLSIKHTKKIAIANKESIICAWNILNKELKKNKTIFVPVDSEHFSISRAIDNHSKKILIKFL
jgi:1-deoxy-D-xylulose-5-phosphate reductoisomerase